MKLTYWYAARRDDSNCYSIRAKTKKEAVAERERRGEEDYGEVKKIEVYYTDAFDLLTQCLGEGGIGDEDGPEI